MTAVWQKVVLINSDGQHFARIPWVSFWHEKPNLSLIITSSLTFNICLPPQPVKTLPTHTMTSPHTSCGQSIWFTALAGPPAAHSTDYRDYTLLVKSKGPFGFVRLPCSCQGIPCCSTFEVLFPVTADTKGRRLKGAVGHRNSTLRLGRGLLFIPTQQAIASVKQIFY